jgi:hypothetical protein
MVLHLSHVNSAATYAEEYWHILRSGCRNTLINAHAPLNCDINLGSLKLPRLKVETLWNYSCYTLCMVPSKAFANPSFRSGSPPPRPPQSRIVTSAFTTHLLSLKCFFLWEDSSNVWTRDSQDGLLLARNKIWSKLKIFLLLAFWCYGDAKLSVLEPPKRCFLPHPTLPNCKTGHQEHSYVHKFINSNSN